MTPHRSCTNPHQCFTLQSATVCAFTQTAGQPTTVTVAAGTSNSASHVCRIQVTFPVFGNAALTLDTTVNAVLMKSVVLSAQTYDSISTPASTTSTEPGPLQPINCNTTDYEQVGCLVLLVTFGQVVSRKLLLGLLHATQHFNLPSACSNDAVTRDLILLQKCSLC